GDGHPNGLVHEIGGGTERHRCRENFAGVARIRMSPRNRGRLRLIALAERQVPGEASGIDEDAVAGEDSSRAAVTLEINPRDAVALEDERGYFCACPYRNVVGQRQLQQSSLQRGSSRGVGFTADLRPQPSAEQLQSDAAPGPAAMRECCGS